MSFVNQVRGKVTEIVNREKKLWAKTTKHSTDYCNALRLSEDDLDALNRNKPRGSILPDVHEHASHSFLQVSVGVQEFALTVHHTCGAPYGGTWISLVLAICISNDSLNESIGDGTTLITTIPDEWHDKLVARLMESDTSVVSH